MNQLKTVIDIKVQVSKLRDERRQLEKTRKDIFQDQERLRENLKALRVSTEDKNLRKRYLIELESQENQLKDLSVNISELDLSLSETETRLNEAIRGLRWEGTITKTE